ncbi:Protein of unknown function [Nonomuraea solani]|uniref:DUF2797 domain-containing protein n=1 Tax=Nonomuraea solani TaxID=1144553 RepID=A0A1H5SXN3_9ACTN|nr:DUF2797 domain-containing protein [Nonomuraea solani]SEF55372.1 Protein of unknown function [Nonomuraea solani]
MKRETGRQYLWHSITWAARVPTLLLADTTTGALGQVEVMSLQLGLKVVDRARFCTGRYGFTDTFRVEPRACPQQAVAERGGQCATCLERDDFRFAHQVHKSGHVPPALAAYMAQPHWLYIATFANSVSKVGTAAASRRTSRLDEQGPIRATYIAQAPNGHAVRRLEDTLSRELGLAQTIRSTAKLAALIAFDHDHVDAAHDKAVDRTHATLTAAGVAPEREAWTPPPESHALRNFPRSPERAIYPHDLRTGEHGFSIEACSGSHVMARLSSGADDIPYVLDLNTLKGHRVLIGNYTSPRTTVQGSLF